MFNEVMAARRHIGLLVVEAFIYFFPTHHIIGYVEMKKLFNLKKLVKCDKDSLKLASRTLCFTV